MLSAIKKLQNIDAKQLLSLLKDNYLDISKTLRNLDINPKHPKARTTLKNIVLAIESIPFNTKEYYSLPRYTTEELKQACKNSLCFGDLKKLLKLSPHGSNNVSLKRMMIRENIDFSHFDPIQARFKNRKDFYTFDEIFCKNSTYARSSLGIKVKQLQLFPYVCSICNNIDIWNNLPLKLQLDHINSVHNDNRIENLRWLCPNCHSQTDNYAGKNTLKQRRTYD